MPGNKRVVPANEVSFFGSIAELQLQSMRSLTHAHTEPGEGLFIFTALDPETSWHLLRVGHGQIGGKSRVLLQLYRKRQQKREDTVLRGTRGHTLGYGTPKTPFTWKFYIFFTW